MPVTTRKTNIDRHPGEIVAPKARRTSAQKAADDAAKAKAKADLEKKRNEQKKKIAQMEKQMADVQERLRIAREHAEDDMELDARASYEEDGHTDAHTPVDNDDHKIGARMAEREPEDISDVEMASANNSDADADADADANANADVDADADDDADGNAIANATSEATNAHAGHGGLSTDADAGSAVASNQGEDSEQHISAKRDGTSQTRPAFLTMSDGSKRRVRLVSMEIPSQHEASSPSPNARKRPLGRNQNNSAFSESELSEIETPVISKHLQKKKKLTSQPTGVQAEASEAMSSGQSVTSLRQVSRGLARHSAIALTSRSHSSLRLLISPLHQPDISFLLCSSQASYLSGPCNSIRRPCDATSKQSPANKTLSHRQAF